MGETHGQHARELTVPEMAAEAHVSPDLVRFWCRQGFIDGAWNAGTARKQMWRASRQAFDRFRQSRATQQRRVVTELVVRRAKSGRNLLGL